VRVLVTRPLEDARETQDVLKERGHDAIVAPLLKVNFHPGRAIDLSGYQAVLATSANGVRALSVRTARRDLPLFAVGPQTAQTARDAGFTNVKSADGDAVALANAVPVWTRADRGPLLHATGAAGEGRLAKLLADAGFEVHTEILYDVDAVDGLSPAVRDALADNRIDAVLLYSPRSARIFAQSIIAAGLGAAAARLIGVCISPTTAGALAPLAMREIRIAFEPNQAALLACLDPGLTR